MRLWLNDAEMHLNDDYENNESLCANFLIVSSQRGLDHSQFGRSFATSLSLYTYVHTHVCIYTRVCTLSGFARARRQGRGLWRRKRATRGGRIGRP